MSLLSCVVLPEMQMESTSRRPREFRLYVANGARYQVETKAVETRDESLPDTVSNHRCSGESVITDIGAVNVVPFSFNKLSIFLCDEKNTKVLGNWEADKNNPSSGDMSVIITEEGSVAFGYSDRSAAEWQWISSEDGRNHRPRKSFVANASGREIKVQRAAGDGEYVKIQHGETYTIEYEYIKITDGGKSFHVKPKPRTSTIVFSDHIKVTGQLYGVNIEEEKWIVDGENYKPPKSSTYSNWKEVITCIMWKIFSLATGICLSCIPFSNWSDFAKCFISKLEMWANAQPDGRPVEYR